MYSEYWNRLDRPIRQSETELSISSSLFIYVILSAINGKKSSIIAAIVSVSTVNALTILSIEFYIFLS